MKSAELRALSLDALRAQLNDAKEELMNLRFQQATGELTDYNRLRVTRRLIARLSTILSEHEMAVESEGEA